MSRNDEEILYRAIEQYGSTMQLIVSMEELSELIKEISKSLRGNHNEKAVTEEIADVEIMIMQLKILFNNQNAVEVVKAQKLKRLADRLDGKSE